MNTSANATAQPTVNVHKTRIEAIRQSMKQNHVDALIVPSTDPHLSEYLPDYWQIRVWLSGFDGSVGTLVITAESAGLWVDSRYWEQAEKQLKDTGISLQKITSPQTTPINWLAATLPANSVVAIDGRTLSVATKTEMLAAFAEKAIVLRTDLDLISPIWSSRPALPAEPIYAHPEVYASESSAKKLARLRLVMAEKAANWHLLSSLDDIAWLTNLRGADVQNNPVFLAHMLISKDDAKLFVAANVISLELEKALEKEGITLHDYTAIISELEALPPQDHILLDANKIASHLFNALPVNQISDAINPTTLFKACKSTKDIVHTRRAMEKDGVALCEFFAWLEGALARGETITEITIDEKITAFRCAQADYIGRSFATIAAFNENAALPHYHATKESHAVISGNGLLLIDSGGQYINGTTDITRVVPIGVVSVAQQRDFTTVLKALIALSVAHFPDGIASPLIDAIARAPLWAQGMDYGHGTGHGVGYFLNVHEGPHIISYYAPVKPSTQLREGMVTSIEPGVYRPTQWGIRIENLVVATAAPHQSGDAFGSFLRFETLSLCPIDTRCIDKSLLTQSEISWLNAYHQQVFERLGDKVSNEALAWLTARTRTF